jgi:hypothetical protein
MKSDLDKEKNGDLQGLIGSSMQTIPALEAGDPDAENVG